VNWPSECVVVIPCLNEGAGISGLVKAVRRHLPEVIVVDDGSSDGTAGLAEAAGAEVIRHERSLGKGAALGAGWRRAKKRGFSWALALDGDGQHSPEDIPALLSMAGGGGVDLVVGNRMGDAGRMPWLRRRVNQWMSLRLSKAAGVLLPDSQCGFRLMRLSAWSALVIETTHFEIESEVLLGFVAQGFSVKFVPIQVIYRDEQSKIHPVRDGVRWFRWWARARQPTKRAKVR
jgi:glycosyltransferase involved in cell wall biosynthesis